MSGYPARGGGIVRPFAIAMIGSCLAIPAVAEPNFGKTSAFDSTSQLDLDGNMIYAVNVSPNVEENFSIGDLMFTSSENTAGVTLSSTHSRDNWLDRPQFAESQGSEALESIMWDMRFSTRGEVNIDMAVTEGSEYQLQLLFSDAFWTEEGMRRFDVVIENALAIDEFDIASVTGPREGAVNRGAVYTLTFVAMDNNLDIDLLHGTTGQDSIPLINGFTLEMVPSPASLALLAVGSAPLLIGRRRRDEA